MKTKAKQVRLGFELAALEEAVAGAWLLVDALAHHQLAEEQHVTLAPRAVASILALVGSRLTQVGRVLRGNADPRLIWAAHNDAAGLPLEAGSKDVLLPVWEGPGSAGTSQRRRRRQQ